MNIKILVNVSVASILFSFAFQSLAQSGNGTIKGHIADSSGSPVTRASVYLEGTSFGSTTDENGNFTITNIPPGNYTLVASNMGYKASRKDVNVESNKTLSLNLKLREEILELDEVQIFYTDKKSYKAENPSEQLRLQTTLMETPQDIIVVSEQVMKDQQAFNVNELARNVSGVNSVFSYSNLYADFNIRGGGQSTGNNRLRNGIKPNWYAMMEDVSNIERVEFVKGPAGFMMNYGDP